MIKYFLCVFSVVILMVSGLSIGAETYSTGLYGKEEPYEVASGVDTTVFLYLSETSGYTEFTANVTVKTSDGDVWYHRVGNSELVQTEDGLINLFPIERDYNPGSYYLTAFFFDVGTGDFLYNESFVIHALDKESVSGSIWSIHIHSDNPMKGDTYEVDFLIDANRSDVDVVNINDFVGNTYTCDIRSYEDMIVATTDLQFFGVGDYPLSVQVVYDTTYTDVYNVEIFVDDLELANPESVAYCKGNDTRYLVINAGVDDTVYGRYYFVGDNVHILVESETGVSVQSIILDVREVPTTISSGLLFDKDVNRIVVTSDFPYELRVSYRGRSFGRLFTGIRVSGYNTWREAYGLMADVSVERYDDDNYFHYVPGGETSGAIVITYK